MSLLFVFLFLGWSSFPTDVCVSQLFFDWEVHDRWWLNISQSNRMKRRGWLHCSIDEFWVHFHRKVGARLSSVSQKWEGENESRRLGMEMIFLWTGNLVVSSTFGKTPVFPRDEVTVWLWSAELDHSVMTSWSWSSHVGFICQVADQSVNVCTFLGDLWHLLR